MKRNTIRILIPLIILGLVAAGIVWKYTFRQTENSVASKKADIELDADKLIAFFETNEDSANVAFLNKIIVVTGNVDNIKQDNSVVTVYLKNQGSTTGIICSFDKSIIDIGVIKPGEPLKIKGICTGYLLDVVLNKCSIEK